MKKKEIWTVAQHHYARYASEFSEKETQGENSLQTPSPQGEHKKHCAKLNWLDDAVAMADMKNKQYFNRRRKEDDTYRNLAFGFSW
jgi:hypothetical protein